MCMLCVRIVRRYTLYLCIGVLPLIVFLVEVIRFGTVVIRLVLLSFCIM